MKEFEMPLPTLFSSGKVEMENSSNEIKSESFEIFTECFPPIKNQLYNFILKSLNFSEDANDVFQDTVARALKYFNNFNRTMPFKPWIFSIGYNEIKRYFKNNNSIHSEKNINELCNIISEETDKELVKAVYSVAEKLKSQDRQVFFLFYNYGFSVIEISGMMGIKPGNIKVILSNARKKVRGLLEV